MKYLLIILFALLQIPVSVLGQFDTFFNDRTLRVDYYHIGDAQTEIITVDRMQVYGIWGGSRKNLIDGFNNGRYYAKIYDTSSGDLIFSRGFDSYFAEYKTSASAADGVKRTYHESVLLPEPKAKIRFVLERRNQQNELDSLFSIVIDPQDNSILRERVEDKNILVYNSAVNGDPHGCTDIVILGEGYTVAQEAKFKNDLNRFSRILFNHEPYRSYRKNINVYGVLKFALDSGVDEPRADIYRRTPLNATFNSLGSERYLLTEDNRAVRDLAAQVPYDAIYIMVNHSRYGGGGIYNLYCTFTTDNQWNEYLYLHEFGHSFAGLADEYYTSDVAYNDFYARGIEPVEPNITAFLDPAKLKWHEQVTPSLALPTPWEKSDYDTMDLAWQKRRRRMNAGIAELKRKRADNDKISAAEDEYVREDRRHADKVDAYLKSSKFHNMVGVFEGAGYSAQGLYRPMLDCIMFSKGSKPFCVVCNKAIVKVLEHYME